MDKDDVVKLDSRGISAPMNNRAFDGDPNLGSRGKLNSEQLIERTKLHAKRLALGSPTVPEIAEHWYKTYEISMNPRSEREWADNNHDKIVDMQQIMERTNEIEVVHSSNAALSNTLAHGAREKVNLIKKSHKEISAIWNSLNESKDVWKVVGITKEEYKNAPNAEKKEYRKDIELALKIRDTEIKALEKYSGVSNKGCENLKDLVELAMKMNNSDFILDKRVKDTLRAEKQRKSLEDADKEKGLLVDPMAEVTDAERTD
jgi:hypothetical protein